LPGAAQASGRDLRVRGRYIALVSEVTPDFPPRAFPAVYGDLDAALRELSAFRYAREDIATASSVPGGRYAHGLVDKAVRRQVDGILQQAQTHADRVNRYLVLLTEVVVQQLDDLQDGLAELRRSVNALAADRELP
jgi:hypothetical protein